VFLLSSPPAAAMECKLVTPESSWYLEAVVGLVLEPENKDMLA